MLSVFFRVRRSRGLLNKIFTENALNVTAEKGISGVPIACVTVAAFIATVKVLANASQRASVP